MPRFLILDVVGLTPRLLSSGQMPRLEAFARLRSLRPLDPGLPAVTASVQATFLTGAPPSVHGAVGNGWYFRDLAEIRLWRQSCRLLQAPTILDRWRELHPGHPSAQLFWWWNLPSRADWSVTPRPAYHADGRKDPDVHAHPAELRDGLNRKLGWFPLFRFWGPGASIASTRWIVSAALKVLEERRPGLTLVYLPHLDYDLQRFGPDAPQALEAAAAVDAEAGRLLDHAAADGIEVVVVSEYGITPVRAAVFPNRLLRAKGLLAVHPARNGALLDAGNSRAFAVCDHQCAQVYVPDEGNRKRARGLLEGLDGVERVFGHEELGPLGLDHPRSGELFLLAAPDRWFAYPYWDGDDREPDFARMVDIHAKPGYDPCELFLDPAIRFPRVRVALKLFAKRLGFRAPMNFIPLDTSLVRGSHGRLPENSEEGPVWIGDPRFAPQGEGPVPAPQALTRLF
ncbi:MAG: alkaline phosphatase family protein [Planctomycetota bacterium]